VHSPKRMPIDEIEKFILSKSDWLDKNIKKNSSAILKNEEIINYTHALVYGQTVKLTIGERNNISENGVEVKSLKHIKDVYLKFLQDDFLIKFENICKACNLKAASVKLRDYKSRWGCCDSFNNIIFNYKILMLPESLQNYVILHELCHTIYHNHSAKFWNAVKKFMPDFKERRIQIKSYSFLNAIYA
jgi:hypothetical protein